MNRAAKKEYDILLKNEELLEMFPDFTGRWGKDKKAFLQYWESNQEILNLEVDFIDDLEDNDPY